MTRVYISGFKGFIGSNLKNIMEKNGYDCINEEVNLNEINKLKKYLPIDIIIHCAAIVGSVPCDSNKKLAFETNVLGTRNIAKFANDINSKFVYMSSVSIYEYKNKYNIIDETSKIKPNTLYGITKYLGEEVVKIIFEDNFLNIRLGFIYGNVKEDPHSVISGLIQNKKVPLVGKYYKDYLYIDDCINAILKLIQKNSTGIFNLGSGQSYSISNIVKIISSKNSVFEFDNKGDYYKNFIININKINNEINWEPKVNFFEKIKELKEEYDKFKR